MYSEPTRRAGLRHLDWLPPSAAVVLFAGLALYRASALEDGVGTYSGCKGCFWLSSLGHDAWLLGVVLGLLAVGYWCNLSGLRLLSRVAACLLLLFFAGDIATTALLSQRLYLIDIVRFGRHGASDVSVIVAALGSRAGLVGAGAGLLVAASSFGIVALGGRRPRLAMAIVLAALGCTVFSLYARTRQMHYVHELVLENIIEANLPQGRVAAYSPRYIEHQRALAAAVSEPESCSAGPIAPRNVIVLTVESLSAWQSRLLGGMQDWTPKLDDIARSNHYFSNFHANGFTTSTGEISVLAGRTPLIPPGKAWFDFGDYADGEGSLPDIAHRSRHEAAFFTTGDVSFLGLGDWLKQIGFDVVDGSKDAFYDGRKRWQFDAADDGALYDRFLEWLAKRDATRPFVAAMETVSSHPPYVDPRSGAIDAEGSFRYVDEQIGRFHAELQKRGFFDDGLLLVLGDHRTMTPLHEDEFSAYGERAFSRIPLIVVGPVDMPLVVDDAFQQTDIAPSVGEWLGLRECSGPFTGLFLRSTPVPADYVLHVRGDNRNRVDVYNGAELGGLLLDGDKSRWIESPSSNAGFVAAWIAVQRDEARTRGLHAASQLKNARP